MIRSMLSMFRSSRFVDAYPFSNLDPEEVRSSLRFKICSTINNFNFNDFNRKGRVKEERTRH